MAEWFKPERPATADGDLGLCFHTPRRLTPGCRIELTIPLRHGSHRFLATIVLVREWQTAFEVGVWFDSIEDGARTRLVERVRELESRLLRRGAAMEPAPGRPPTEPPACASSGADTLPAIIRAAPPFCPRGPVP